MTNEQNKIIKLISLQIGAALRQQKNEERFPRSSADEMDQVIINSKKTVAALRQHRAELEELFTDASL